MLGEFPDELAADMQQVYGLDVDRMGHGFTASHAAALCSQLPRGSRVHLAASEREKRMKTERSIARMDEIADALGLPVDRR